MLSPKQQRRTLPFFLYLTIYPSSTVCHPPISDCTPTLSALHWSILNFPARKRGPGLARRWRCPWTLPGSLANALSPSCRPLCSGPPPSYRPLCNRNRDPTDGQHLFCLFFRQWKNDFCFQFNLFRLHFLRKVKCLSYYREHIFKFEKMIAKVQKRTFLSHLWESMLGHFQLKKK